MGHRKHSKVHRVMFRMTTRQREEMDEMIAGQGFLWSGCGNESELIREALHRMYQEMQHQRPNPVLLTLSDNTTSADQPAPGRRRPASSSCLSSTDLSSDPAASVPSQVEDRFPMRSVTFDAIWDGLAVKGKCDQRGGAEYTRIFDEWWKMNRPGPITQFILARANLMPTSPAVAGDGGSEKITSTKTRKAKSSDSGIPPSDNNTKGNGRGARSKKPAGVDATPRVRPGRNGGRHQPKAKPGQTAGIPSDTAKSARPANGRARPARPRKPR